MITVDRVSKAFGAGTAAVAAVSFTVAKGEFVALCGDSGSGKTTLLKTINRLIEPDTGSISINGRSALALPAHALRREIGYVFQGTGLFPHMSVAENIGVTPRLLRWPQAAVAARVEEMIDLVALPREYLRRAPTELSGGQQQRVGVARALAASPSIMLMDEPFGALDPVTRSTIGDEYRRLHETMGLTTLMVTHDVQEAVLLADRIMILRAGALVADGAPHELLRGHPDPGVRALLDTPRRQALRVRARLDAADADALSGLNTSGVNDV